MQYSVGTDEEHSAALLVAAAEALLTAQDPKVPSDFVAGLFGRAAPEDLVRYDGRDIAALGESAWAFLAQRTPGHPKLRVATIANAGELLRQVSVIEIVNDDMPFLLDSVMGELATRGIEVRLVVHPVFTVKRDASGRLTGFEGLKASTKEEGLKASTKKAGLKASTKKKVLRESFIHIHLDHIPDQAQRAELLAALETVLADVRLGVQDWRAMTARVSEIAAGLK